MGEQDLTKVKSRIASWQACVGAGSDEPALPTAGASDPLSRDLPARAPDTVYLTAVGGAAEGATNAGGMDDLRESLRFERERSASLAATVHREQALHAATLYLQAGQKGASSPPGLPSREALEAAVALGAQQRKREALARQRNLAAAGIALAALVVVTGMYLLHLW